MEIRRLNTADEIARLAEYRDDSPDPLMVCDYGQFIQWMTDVMPRHPKTLALFAAFDDVCGIYERIVGYIAVATCDMRPLYHFGTVLRFHAHEPDAVRLLGKAALEWGRERGVPQISVSVYDERHKQLYERVFGFSEIGWQLHRSL